jgi:predicted TIM-barrel fold metal-dependent hydrolase
MRTKPSRVLFGTDWPSAAFDEQWNESVRLAEAEGVAAEALAELLLANSRRYWP